MMSTIGAQLEFAIRFARMDLDHLSRGDWLNLCDAVRIFIYGAHDRAREIGFMPWPEVNDFSDPTPERFHALQADVRKVMSGNVVAREDYEQHQRGERVTRHAPLDLPEIRATTWLFWNTDNGQSYMNASGSSRDMFLLKLMFLLAQDVSHVRRCDACHEVFYRVRHQRFCSPSCRNRTNTRRFREVHHGRGQLPQADTQSDRQGEQRKSQRRGVARLPDTVSLTTA
jgi:hypothetical protein